MLTLCLIISSCGGFSVVAGLKFKKSVGAKSNAGNASFTEDTLKLGSKGYVSFKRPMGKCGASITFFGIILPVIPVWVTLNDCKKEFAIDFSGPTGEEDKVTMKLKYNGNVYDSVYTKELAHEYKGEKYIYGKKYKFKIDNFWKFRMADDKTIIVTGKTESGEEFTQELPVKWGIMIYNNWAIP